MLRSDLIDSVINPYRPTRNEIITEFILIMEILSVANVLVGHWLTTARMLLVGATRMQAHPDNGCPGVSSLVEKLYHP